MFFDSNDYTHGAELWSSDGTSDGTTLVKNIVGGIYSSFPLYLTNVNGTLFFSAETVNGRELWSSDGSLAGTTLVNDIFPLGKSNGPNNSNPNFLTNINGTLFFSANGGISGTELWVLPPTPADSLDVSLIGGDLAITDTDVTGKNNQFTISRTGNFLSITDSNEQFTAAPLGGTLSTGKKTLSFDVTVTPIATLTLNGAFGNDTVNVDLSTGNPIPSGGIVFNGGSQTTGPGDTLVVTGGTTNSQTFNFTNEHDGSVVLAGAIAGTINYTGLEPVSSTVNAADVILNYRAVSEVITVTQDATDTTMTKVDSDVGGESVAFTNPTNSLQINAGDTGNDTINVNSFGTSGGGFKASLTINGGTGDDTVNLNADITFASDNNLEVDLTDDAVAGDVDAINIGANVDLILSGVGAVTLKVSKSIALANGSSVVTVNGNLSLQANQQVTPTAGNFIGIDIHGASIGTSGSGNVELIGRGGDDMAGLQYGVSVHMGGAVRPTGSGNVAIEGTGGTSDGSNNYGIFLDGTDTLIASGAGNVVVNGTGGGNYAQGALNHGVRISNSALLTSGGNGAVLVNGRGGPSLGLSRGVDVEGSAQITSSGNGTVTVSGVGGLGVSGGDEGVRVSNATITSGGGDLTVSGTGTASGGLNYGVHLENAAVVSSGGDGNTYVIGTGGESSEGNLNVGVYLESYSRITSMGNGNVVVTGIGGNGGSGNIGVYVNRSRITSGGTGKVNVSGEGGTDLSGEPESGDYNVGVYLLQGDIFSGEDGIVSVTGTGGSGIGSNNAGVYVFGGISSGPEGGGVVVTGTGTDTSDGIVIVVSINGWNDAPIAIVSNSVSILGLVATQGTVSITPLLTGIAINLGEEDTLTGGVLSLGLTDAELDRVTAGTINIGDANSGPITFSTNIDRATSTNLNFTAGSDHNINFSSFALNAGTDGDVSLTTSGAGAIVSSDNTGTDLISDDVTLNAGSGGIGSTTNFFRLAATTVTATSGGGINLVEADSVTIGSSDLSAGLGLVTLDGGTFLTTATGSILSSVKVNSGATLGGTGTTGAIITKSGGNVAPGVSPGILNTGNTTLESGANFNVEIDGTIVGTQCDQVNVTGSVSLGDASLNVTFGYTPANGDAIKIINNDNADAVVGNFAGLVEGAIFLVGGRSFSISYLGGDGNDVVLTAVPSVRTWDGGGANNNWSTPENWGEDVAPVALDKLVFPTGAARLTNVNDFTAGMSFTSFTFSGGDYNITGNSVILANGILNTANSGYDNLYLAIQLSNSQTFSKPFPIGPGVQLLGSLDLNGHDLTVDTVGGYYIFYGQISGNGSVIKTGTGGMALSNSLPNTYTGSTIVNGGTVFIQLGNEGVTAIPGTLIIGDGVGADYVIARSSNRIADSAIVTVNSLGQLLFDTFNSNEQYGVNETIASLSLTGGTVSTNGQGLGTLTVVGDISTGLSTITSTISGQLSLGGATRSITVADGLATTDLSIAATISNGGITKEGLGTLALSGANTYIGTTTINAGTLALNGGSALSDIGAVVIANVSGATLSLASSETIGSLSGGGAGGGNVSLSGFTLTTGDASNATFAGSLSGTGGLTKEGAGTLTLSRANTYTGPTTINAGTLLVGGSGALPSTSAVNVGSGGALDLNASGGFGSNIGSLAGSGLVLLGNAPLQMGFDNTSTTFSGVIRRNGSLAKYGSGVFTLSGTLQDIGQFNIEGGTLQLGASERIADGRYVSVGIGSTLDLNGFNETVGGMDGSPGTRITLGTGTLTEGGLDLSDNFFGEISGSGGLTKTGTGTLTLSAASTYSGPTNVNAGTLLVNGSTAASSAVLVASAATLGGTGLVGGTITVSSLGSVSPGSNAGILSSGNVALNTGSILRVELNGPNSVAGIDYDQLNVMGSVNLSGATLSVTRSYSPIDGTQFLVIANDGIDAVNGTFAGLAEGKRLNLNGSQFRISYVGGDGNDVVLTVVPSQPPTVTMSAPLDGFSGVTGQSRVIRLTATDATNNGVLPFVYEILWGDGTPIERISGPAILDASHVFESIGSKSVQVRVIDPDDEASGLVTRTLNILRTELQGPILAVGGNNGSDTLSFTPGTASPTANLTLNAVSLGNFSVPVDGVQFFGGIGTDSLVMNGTAGNDVFSVDGSSAVWNGSATWPQPVRVRGFDAETLRVQALGGNDDINVVSGSAEIVGGSGIDRVLGPTAGATWNVTGAGVGAVNGVAFTTIESLVGGNGIDAFMFSGIGALTGTINGGSGLDTLDYSGRATAVVVSLIANTASGTAGFSNVEQLIGSASATDVLSGANTINNWSLSSDGSTLLNSTYAIRGFETLNGGTGVDTFSIGTGVATTPLLNGGSGTDILSYSGRSDAVVVDRNTRTATGVSSFNLIEQFVGGNNIDTLIGTNSATTWAINTGNLGTFTGGTFAGFEKLVGGSSSDAFTLLSDTASGEIVGGAGVDTLTALNTANNWSLTGNQSGSLNSLILFSGVESVKGGTSTDSFAIGAAAAGFSSVDGSTGIDTLDYSSSTLAATVNLANRSATGIALFAGIEALIGSIATDTLIGANATTAWTLNGPDSGLSGTMQFSSFGNLTGGSGNDTFTISTNTASVSGQINGGAGVDTVVGFNSPNVWNLNGSRSGSVNDSVPFANIENLTGGTLVDQFIFSDAADNFGTINGGLGFDSLDYSLVTSAIEFNLSALAAPKVTTFTAMETLIGTAESDTLQGADVANAWTISGANSGRIGTLDFASFENLAGGSLADTFTVTTSSAALSGGAFGGDGVDTLIGFNSANIWSLTNFLSGNLNATLGFSQIENLTGNAASDSFMVGSLADGFVLINGGLGIDVIDYSSFAGPITFDIANKIYPGLVNYSAIESILGTMDADTLMGANIANAWTISGPNSGKIGTLGFASFENLLGGSLVDNFTVSTATGLLTGALSGGDGVDTLVGFNGLSMWNLNGFNTGSIENTLAFSEIENLTGGTGIDTYLVGIAADGFGIINGGAGSDTVDYSNFGGPVTVNLGAKTAPAIASLNAVESLIGSGGEDLLIGANAVTAWTITALNTGKSGTINFASFENLAGSSLADTFTLTSGVSSLSGQVIGGDGVDTLIGFNLANLWNLSGVRSGDINTTVAFSEIENLTGGTGAESFLFSDSASGFGVINGGTGLDTLDYSTTLAPVTVNLQSKTSPGLTSFTSIEATIGGSSADTLIGSNANTAWSVLGSGTGQSGTIPFQSFENLIGGTGVDTFTLATGSANSIFGGAGIDVLIGAGIENEWVVNGVGAGSVDDQSAVFSVREPNWRSSRRSIHDRTYRSCSRHTQRWSGH